MSKVKAAAKATSNASSEKNGNGVPTIAGFAERHAAKIETIMKKYPSRRSGVMPVLWLVQDEQGWISPDAMKIVAGICDMQPAEVMEMVTFYTMYNREPAGKFVLGVCNTLPCALCGSEGLIDYLKSKLGVHVDENTPDGLFRIKKVECLGACSEAPLMLVNKKLATKLTRAKVDELLQRCRQGEEI